MNAMSMNRYALLSLTVLFSIAVQAQWSMYNHPGYQSIFSVTTTPGAIHMVSYGNGVITSTNGGANWNPTNSGLPTGTAVESVFYNGNVLFAGTHNGVYKSTNGGASWTLSNTGLPASSQANFVSAPPPSRCSRARSGAIRAACGAPRMTAPTGSAATAG